MAGLPQEHPKPSYGTLLLKLWSPYPPPHPSHPLPSCWRQGRAGGEPWGGGGRHHYPFPPTTSPPRSSFPRGDAGEGLNPISPPAPSLGQGTGYPPARGCQGTAPSPLTTPSPRLLPPQWFIGVGAQSPPPSRGVEGGEGAPQEPRFPRRGPISSLTKAAMQYWRATGNPKLQYLRAARALLTALHSPAPLRGPPKPSLSPPPQKKPHRARVPWPILCREKDGRTTGEGSGATLRARRSRQRRPCPCRRRKRSYKSFLPAGPTPPRHHKRTHTRTHTHNLKGTALAAAKDADRYKHQENLSARTCSTELKRERGVCALSPHSCGTQKLTFLSYP